MEDELFGLGRFCHVQICRYNFQFKYTFAVKTNVQKSRPHTPSAQTELQMSRGVDQVMRGEIKKIRDEVVHFQQEVVQMQRASAASMSPRPVFSPFGPSGSSQFSPTGSTGQPSPTA